MTLSLEAVSYAYPGTRTGVHDLSLRIAPGEIVALIGASGSGKTTALKLLAGFATPDTGRVRVGGGDVTAMPAQERRLGIVFQNYALFPHLSALENIAFPLRVRGRPPAERRRKAAEMLERVGMGGRADAMPHQLSGGQQQRVALARALVFEPEGLLLDEPLSALDAALRVEMRDEILRVQRQAGIATLLVTHDQEEALTLGDRVGVMRDGRIVQVATPRELYDAPANAYVAGFVGQSNLWRATVLQPGLAQTPIGVLGCDTGARRAGETVFALVRPDRIEPLAQLSGHGQAGEFAGTLVADRFLGASRRLDFAVGLGTVRIETNTRETVQALRIPPQAVLLLPD